MYSLGKKFRISLFGRSHADCIGCVIEGLPMGMKIDETFIKKRMDLRKPSDGIGTPRKEKDSVIFEQGVTDGKVSSSSVMLIINNSNTKSSSYAGFDVTPRPGHADLPALIKFKDFDISGGGQFSGRMTAPIVAAGAIAQQILSQKGIRIAACTKSIYDVDDQKEHTFQEIAGSERFKTRAANIDMDFKMNDAILKASKDGDSVGGVITCMIDGLDAGFGGIWFEALDTCLARAMFSIPGVKGVEFGKGFSITRMRGSESNDQYCMKDGKISALTNNMGGICGGMCDGMPVVFNVAVKPTPSISKEQRTVNLKTLKDDTVTIQGRHDPCIVPRAVAVVEAFAAIVVLDQLMSQSDK